MQVAVGIEQFNILIESLSEYSKIAVKGIATCKKISITGSKNLVVDVARKIAKVKRPGH